MELQGPRPRRRIVILLVLCLFLLGPVRSLEYQIREEIPPGSFVASAAADATVKAELLGRVWFSFLVSTGVHALYLMVDSRTGILRTARRIDRETICANSPSCIIQADVRINPVRYFEIVKMRVNIVDINDNAPVFPRSVLQLSISEAKTPGSRYPVTPAQDLDSPANGIRRYELLSNHSNSFDLKYRDVNGEGSLDLVLKTRLDREVVEYYQLKVVAYDGGTPRRSAILVLLINVTDINDNDPVFTNDTYEATILENAPTGTLVTKVTARDPDEGLNGEVVYTFSGLTLQKYRQFFRISNKTGEIRLKRRLDYQKGPVHHLTVLARDKGSGSSPAIGRIIVTVKDVNDHQPSITVNAPNAIGRVRLSESSSIGSFVAHISVTDEDGGKNGRFGCQIDNHMFKLQHLSTTQFKIITNLELDRELKAGYKISFVCRDHGNPPLKAEKKLTIEVTDVNDCTPIFAKAVFHGKLQENNPIGASILIVNATDKDYGNNSKLSYALLGNVPMLHINPRTGLISARVSFDHETTTRVEAIVTAADHGRPPLTSTATVIIEIGDINDTPPRFTQSHYTFGIFENQPPGSEVGRIFATDPDSSLSGQIEFSIRVSVAHSDIDIHNVLSINPWSGVIKTKLTLDRENRSSYYCKVEARDRLQPRMMSEVNITVYVADVNDNAPIIDYPKVENDTVRISSLVVRGYPVAKVRARDLDTGMNARLRYRLQHNQDIFVIDRNTGLITTNVDFRSVQQKVFGLVIVVEDLGHPVQRTQGGLFVVVNKSVEPSMARTKSLVTANQLLVVVVLAGTLGVILVILIAVVIIIVRKQNRRDNSGRRCNYGDLVTVAPQELQQEAINTLDKSLDASDKADEQTDDVDDTDNWSPRQVPNHVGHDLENLQDDQIISKSGNSDTDSMGSADVSNADSGHGGSEKSDIHAPTSREPIVAFRSPGECDAPEKNIRSGRVPNNMQTPNGRTAQPLNHNNIGIFPQTEETDCPNNIGFGKHHPGKPPKLCNVSFSTESTNPHQLMTQADNPIFRRVSPRTASQNVCASPSGSQSPTLCKTPVLCQVPPSVQSRKVPPAAPSGQSSNFSRAALVSPQRNLTGNRPNLFNRGGTPLIGHRSNGSDFVSEQEPVVTESLSTGSPNVQDYNKLIAAVDAFKMSLVSKSSTSVDDTDTSSCSGESLAEDTVFYEETDEFGETVI